jgi:hypothetical protein
LYVISPDVRQRKRRCQPVDGILFYQTERKYFMIMTSAKSIMTAGTAGTSAMTALSYLVSEEKNKQFKEPELLGELLVRLVPQTGQRFAQTAGWAAHYAVGFGFTTVYNFLWRNTQMKPSFSGGLFLGAVSGVFGAAVWKTVFQLHPNPPKTDFKKYYLHLLVAHLVFGFATALTYRATLPPASPRVV